jgi:hypothetical protein
VVRWILFKCELHNLIGDYFRRGRPLRYICALMVVFNRMAEMTSDARGVRPGDSKLQYLVRQRHEAKSERR